MALMCLIISGTAFSQDISDTLAEINKKIAHLGLAIHKAEYYVFPDKEHPMGRTIYADDRTLTLDTRWVANDPRRLADGDNLTYLIDLTYSMANPGIPASPAIMSAFDTWYYDPKCSHVDIVQRTDTGANPNFVLYYYFGIGPYPNPFLADITVTGFLPGYIFDALAPGGSGYILGVTFTFIFVDGNGIPTDINYDGYADTALKEIWFNNNYTWSDTGSGGIDIETVVLHEAGHALDLGHFGSIFVTEKNGKLHVAPRAVMNSIYLGVFRTLRATDFGAFCNIYAMWPNY